MNTPLILSLLFLLVAVAVLIVINRFGNLKRASPLAIFIVAISWIFPFASFLLLPLDLLSTQYDACLAKQLGDGDLYCKEPLLFVDQTTLYILWRIVYWTSFALTWLIIPIFQTFLDQGGFNWRSKLRWAITRQLLYFLIAGSIGALFITYLVLKQGLRTRDALVTYLVAISNSYALILIIAFMGYGLVDVPKKLWLRSWPEKRLQQLEYEAPPAREKLIDSEHSLRDAVDQLRAAMDRLDSNDPLQGDITKILATPGLDPEDRGFGMQRASLPSVVTEQLLAKIHLTLKRSILQRDRSHAQWRSLLQEAFHVQDILANSDFSNRRLTSSLVVLSGSKWDDFRVSIDWWAYVIIQPWMFRLCSLLAVLLTIVILWSELTFFAKTSPPISLVALLFYEAQGQYALLQIASAVLLIYMSWCAYSTLFQLRIFNYYVLVPDKHTDEISLLFCGAYLCRLAMPLYYNYLLLASTGTGRDTVFSALMGKMNLMPFLGAKFYEWFPFLILLPVLSAILGLHRRVAQYFSLDSILATDSSQSGRRREGRELLKTERALEERRNVFSSSNHRSSENFSRGQRGSTYNPSSRSIAVEIAPQSTTVLFDSDDESREEEAAFAPQRRASPQLSTSQKIKQFFREWRFASRPETSDIYQSIHPADSDLDDDDDDTPFEARE